MKDCLQELLHFQLSNCLIKALTTTEGYYNRMDHKSKHVSDPLPYPTLNSVGRLFCVCQ